MANPLYRQLANQARRLARLDPGRPQQGNLRRAVSSAYYAYFHYLTRESCRMILGSANDRQPFRNALARAFDHGTMYRACRSFAGATLPSAVLSCLPPGFLISPHLRQVAQTFVDAQDQRHKADYDLSENFIRADVLAFLREIERAIGLFDGIRGSNEGRFFLASLLAWKSMGSR